MCDARIVRKAASQRDRTHFPEVTSVEKLRSLIASREEWLVCRVLAYARKVGYVRYAPTSEVSWRTAVSTLSRVLADWLVAAVPLPELGPDDDYSAEPAAAFGILEARRHRPRGITLSMFLGFRSQRRGAGLD